MIIHNIYYHHLFLFHLKLIVSSWRVLKKNYYCGIYLFIIIIFWYNKDDVDDEDDDVGDLCVFICKSILDKSMRWSLGLSLCVSVWFSKDIQTWWVYYGSRKGELITIIEFFLFFVFVFLISVYFNGLDYAMRWLLACECGIAIACINRWFSVNGLV